MADSVQISNRQSTIQIVKAASSDIISTLGGDTFSFAMGLMLLHRTHSAISFGLGSIIYPLIGLLLVMPVGNLVDRRRHKPLILLSKATVIVALVLYAVLTANINDPMLLAILLLIVIACCDKVTNTTFTAAVHELVNDKHVKTLATIEQAATAGGEWEQFKIGLVYIKNRLTLRSVVVLGVGLNFLLSSIDVGLPYAIVQERHLGNANLSLVMSGFAGGVLVGNLILSVLPSFKKVLLAVLRLCVLTGVGITLLGIIFLSAFTGRNLVVGLIVWSVAVGLILAFINTPMSVYMQMTVPTKLLGRVGSTFSTLMTLALPAGTIVYGAFFQNFPAGPVYLITGLLVICYTGYQLIRTLRREKVNGQIGQE
ncbi:MFS transporter [Levilactobacillus parabrevis]|uniref:Major facilitator superfamily permease n=1 Tax=Levilactobacillus parabrevis ATCC 53295 TaxID=1267003 RepID=A0A0R1GSM9_9LACO|nr:MFS transporter [Levilactobacillus parabrevis]KRK36991.1 major facilitator superfamily permease [Levilactobacillus parabrevis ATCC 53295]KRO06146.1 major facilitator superfamily permease [Levilactobacillus parabrevis]